MTARALSYLARPWFFGAVVLLALNDHVFKQLWPGWITGKLSDFAGLTVVATLASVLLGARWGTTLTGLAFIALKVVPGVAELASPLLGGGVTLRDASDLLALVVLPPLGFVLVRQRPDHQARNRLVRRRQRPDQHISTRRGWVVVGLVAALLTTTATSQGPDPQTIDLWFAGGAFYAQVDTRPSDRFVRSTDGGRTWSRIDAVPSGGARPNDTRAEEVCAADGVCYQVRKDGDSAIERRTAPGDPWLNEWFNPTESSSVFSGAINPADSNQVAYIHAARTVVHRIGPHIWEEADVLAAAGASPAGPPWSLIAALCFAGMVVLGAAVAAVMLVVGAIRATVKGAASLVRAHGRRGSDPPDGSS